MKIGHSVGLQDAIFSSSLRLISWADRPEAYGTSNHDMNQLLIIVGPRCTLGIPQKE